MNSEAKNDNFSVLPNEDDFHLHDIIAPDGDMPKNGVHIQGVTRPLEAAIEGMKDAQVRYFDSFDKGTEFYQEALKNAETASERERILKEFSEHEKRGAKTASKNNFSWYHVGLFGVAVVALAIGGPVAAAQVMKRL